MIRLILAILLIGSTAWAGQGMGPGPGIYRVSAPATPGSFTGSDGSAPDTDTFSVKDSGTIDAASYVSIYNNSLKFHIRSTTSGSTAWKIIQSKVGIPTPSDFTLTTKVVTFPGSGTLVLEVSTDSGDYFAIRNDSGAIAAEGAGLWAYAYNYQGEEYLGSGDTIGFHFRYSGGWGFDILHNGVFVSRVPVSNKPTASMYYDVTVSNTTTTFRDSFVDDLILEIP